MWAGCRKYCGGNGRNGFTEDTGRYTDNGAAQDSRLQMTPECMQGICRQRAQEMQQMRRMESEAARLQILTWKADQIRQKPIRTIRMQTIH